jgi:protein SCO1/2
LGTRWPGDVVLRDEGGVPVSLGEFINGKPAIVLFSYFDCTMLCPVLLEGLARSLKGVALDSPRDFAVVVVSIDPRDGAAEARKKKQEFVKRHRPGGGASGWHFLTGNEAAIGRLTEIAGFGYGYDAATQQYAHPAALFILTPEMKLARVLYGVEPAPRDLRFALVEASDGRIGSAADRLLLYCYHYDPLTGKYGSIIMNVMRVSGLVTLLTIAGWISFMLLRDRSAAQEKPVDV